jgi:hypothetical protein
MAARGFLTSGAADETLGTESSSTAVGDEPSARTLASKSPGGRGRAGLWVAIGVYLVLGILANLPAWLHGASHTLQCGGCGDNGQEIWFLTWAAHALTHLVNPLRTNWIDFPYGVDLADNTSMPLAGFMGAPITWVFGPIAAYNVLITFAFASSATACMLACRRWTGTAAAFVGGLLYGFSPYMIGQGAGHLFLLLAPIPPLVLLVLDEVLVRQRLRWWFSGLLLALLEVVELGWSPELFADMALVTAIGVVVFAVAQRRQLRARLPYALPALALGVILTLPFAAVVAKVARSGPDHTKGSVHPVSLLAGLSTDLAGLVVPTTNQRFPLGSTALGSRLVGLTPALKPLVPDVTENGAYIGIPLLILICVGVWKYRRNGLVQFSALMALVALVISMGSRFHLLGHKTPLRLPFDVLAHLPFVDSEVASRYSLFMWLFLALIVAVITDQWLFAPRRPPRHERTSTVGMTNRAFPAALLLVGIVSLVPNWPYNTAETAVPPWFSSPAVQTVPVGSSLLPYPIATNEHNLAELWQALDNFRYRMPGGEAAVPKSHIGVIGKAYEYCWANPTVDEPRPLSLGGARKNLVTWQVQTIVIPLSSLNAACAIRYMTLVVGTRPSHQYDAAVWRLPAPHSGSST